jgi:hypothetical protein
LESADQASGFPGAPLGGSFEISSKAASVTGFFCANVGSVTRRNKIKTRIV